MTTKQLSFAVLAIDGIAVTVAFLIYGYTGNNPFEEDGFITILSGFQLCLLSWLSYKIFQVRNIAKSPFRWQHSHAVWAIVSVGFFLLALDEIVTIHEQLDRLIHFILRLEETNLTDRIDDVLVGLYGLIGIGVLTAYRRELNEYRESFPLFVTGFALMFVMVVFDIITNRFDVMPLFIADRDRALAVHIYVSLSEDALKVFAEAFFVLALCNILERSRSLIRLQKANGSST